MKLKKDFITYDTGGESLLVPLGGADFSGVVRGNATFGAIVACLKEDTDEEAIVETLLQRYDAPRSAIARDVGSALKRLREIGAMEE